METMSGMTYTDIIKKSPIRQNVEQTEGVPVFEQYDEQGAVIDIRKRLKDIETIIHRNQETNKEELRVTIVGEVKAGKSTFINALLAREVAYTDMAEATAAVSEITYGEEECFRILHKDGTFSEFEDEGALVDFMEEKADDREFWKIVDRIHIEVEDEELQGIILVDTPGLMSISSQNVDVTNEYMYEADLLFWVLDSQDLGSTAVQRELEEKLKYGKKTIGIVSKVDKEEDREEIREYIKTHYGMYFDDMIMISGRNAWIAQLEEDDELWEQSHMEDVLHYLSYIRREKNHIKKKSVSQSDYVQLKRDLQLHEYVLSGVNSRKRNYDNDKVLIQNIHNKVKDKIKKELAYWKDCVFLKKEIKHLLECSEEEYESFYQQYSSPAYLEQCLNQVYGQIEADIASEWTEVIHAVSSKHSEIDFCSDFKVERTKSEEIIPELPEENVFDGIKEGGKVGVGIAAAIAGYSAWLGPAAAAITFAEAFTGAIIPVTFVGAVVGGYQIYKRNQSPFAAVNKAQKRKKDAEDLYTCACIYIENKQLPVLQRELILYSERFCDYQIELMRKAVEGFGISYEEEPYQEFVKQVERYMELVKSCIAKLQTEVDSVKPLEAEV